MMRRTVLRRTAAGVHAGDHGVPRMCRRRAEGAEERLLNGIFRVLTVAQDSVTESDQGRLVRAQQLVQGGTVPG